MSNYIIGYHADEIDDVTLQTVEADSWQEALKNVFGNNFEIKETFSLTQQEAAECGYCVNMKQLHRHTDGSYSLVTIL